MSERPPSHQGPRVAEILVPVAIDQTYSYRVPDDLDLATGDLVEVPLGTRQTVGAVWEIAAGAGAAISRRSRPVSTFPPLSENLRSFVDWVARWTLSPRGMVLRMCARAPFAAVEEKPRIGLRRAGPEPKRMTPARARVLAAMEGDLAVTKSELAERAACSTSVIDSLVDEGTLEAVALPPESVAATCDPDFAPPQLEAEQARAAAALVAEVQSRGFSVTLLEGVTGSGKTEVYFEAVAEALRQGRQALILMPEIALTAQFLDRFAKRFGVRPAEWHSGISPRKRARIWTGVAQGEVKVVAGARSALFLPFSDLAVLVVDEEHESAYKQDDGVSYHARDMAVVRGQIDKAAVILASATPSIESRVNAEQGRYKHLKLAARFGGRQAAGDRRCRSAPRIAAARQLDFAAARCGRGRGAGAGEQALLFLNRRGYAPLTLCRACGHRFQCPNCTSWLVEHRFRRALVCHQCGHIERVPQHCPECDNVDTLTPCGPGVERLAEEVAKLWPEAKALILSSDFPGGTARLREELDAVANGACDIIIGTQLVAKGHNFPLLSLVGVIDADVGLSNGDPRAAERTFQILQQVTGRAGRHGAARQGSGADLAAGASGDPRAYFRRCRALLQRGNGAAPPRRAAAVWKACSAHRFGQGPRLGGEPRPRSGARRPCAAAESEMAARGARRSAA